MSVKSDMAANVVVTFFLLAAFTVGFLAGRCNRPHADESHDTEHCVSPAPYIGVEDGVVVPRLSIPARRVR